MDRILGLFVPAIGSSQCRPADIPSLLADKKGRGRWLSERNCHSGFARSGAAGGPGFYGKGPRHDDRALCDLFGRLFCSRSPARAYWHGCGGDGGGWRRGPLFFFAAGWPGLGIFRFLLKFAGDGLLEVLASYIAKGV